MHHLLQKGLIEKDINTILQEKGLCFEETNLDSRFKEDLALDSLDKADLVSELETKFRVTIYSSDAEKILTIGEMVDYIDNAITQPV